MANDARKDPKGRNLRNGETYDLKSGRYRYSYNDATGRRRQIYSWTLTKNDIVPAGKNQKRGESLREKEAQAQAEIVNAVDHKGGNMTVMQLLEKYVAIKASDVRETTRRGYRTQMKFMRTDKLALAMSKKKLREVNALEAEEWLKNLHVKGGRSYSSLHTLKGMLRQAFVLAKKSRWVVDNPFDFGEHVIHVRRQLLRVWDGETDKYYIEMPKTGNGFRDVPMLPDVEKAFRHVMENRPAIAETEIWDELHQESATGFLWLDKDLHYEVAQHWENHLRRARAKFNRIFKNELPPVTPHVARHTFCSNCAGAGMSPKTLQMIMGHSSIEFTLNVYTHLEAGDVRANFFSFMKSGAYDICGYHRRPETIAPEGPADEMDEDEAELSEVPDGEEN